MRGSKEQGKGEMEGKMEVIIEGSRRMVGRE